MRPGSKLGIAICTVDGQHYQAGDAHNATPIQSISKVLSLVVAMRHYPEEDLARRKKILPSPFNSLVQLEMEQASRVIHLSMRALVVCDMLQGRQRAASADAGSCARALRRIPGYYV